MPRSGMLMQAIANRGAAGSHFSPRASEIISLEKKINTQYNGHSSQLSRSIVVWTGSVKSLSLSFIFFANAGTVTAFIIFIVRDSGIKAQYNATFIRPTSSVDKKIDQIKMGEIVAACCNISAPKMGVERL